MPLLLLVLLLPLLLIALMPIILVQRYRVGTARRLARPWVARVTLAAMGGSGLFFLFGAAATTFWAPWALIYATAGLAAGVLLGGLGVALTRWESTPRTLHYTPNRWLVLLVTLLVSARVVYGLWRSVSAVQSGLGSAAALAAFGVAESMGAAGIVIGYYLGYAAGVRWKVRQWEGRALRVI